MYATAILVRKYAILSIYTKLRLLI